MAWKKTAKAIVTHNNIQFDEWMDELRRNNEGAVPESQITRVAKTVLRKADPKQFLLSHATIVASVDTFTPKNAKTGRQMAQGIQIDVRYPNFRINKECQELINNNGDAWDRSLLLSTYRTFIGAQNYLEHIQVPELSKGFIVDAIARDLGHTCYIDILVATDRKHQKLVNDILSGDISGLSMGCVSLFTICTKCGNVAADDTQLCPCIQYEGKGTIFKDENGMDSKIAELVGHVSSPNSNQFIEASWVRNPAFRGAVRRNILNPNTDQIAAKLDVASQVYEIRSSQPLPDGLKKAASVRFAEGQEDDSAQDDSAQDDSDSQDQSQDQGDESSDSGAESKIDELVNKTQELLLEGIVKSLTDKLGPKPEDVGFVQAPIDLTNENDNLVRSSIDFNRKLQKAFPKNVKLVKWATRAYKIVHEGGVKSIRANKMNPRDLVALSWIEDRINNKVYSPILYKAVMSAGPIIKYPSPKSYLAACRVRIGRNVSNKESKFLIWKGKIASFAISN
jgi:hypothetical protein